MKPLILRASPAPGISQGEGQRPGWGAGSHVLTVVVALAAAR